MATVRQRAGDYRYVVTVESKTETAATGGGATITWETEATIRAAVDFGPVGEAQRTGMVQARQAALFRSRYRSDVDTTMRLNWGGRIFYITDVLDTGGRNREMVIHTTERPA